jgi:hypothetical protein
MSGNACISKTALPPNTLMLQFAHRYIEKYGPIFEQCEREGLDPRKSIPIRTISSSMLKVTSRLTGLPVRKTPARGRLLYRKP